MRHSELTSRVLELRSSSGAVIGSWRHADYDCRSAKQSERSYLRIWGLSSIRVRVFRKGTNETLAAFTLARGQRLIKATRRELCAVV